VAKNVLKRKFVSAAGAKDLSRGEKRARLGRSEVEDDEEMDREEDEEEEDEDEDEEEDESDEEDELEEGGQEQQGHQEEQGEDEELEDGIDEDRSAAPAVDSAPRWFRGVRPMDINRAPLQPSRCCDLCDAQVQKVTDPSLRSAGKGSARAGIRCFRCNMVFCTSCCPTPTRASVFKFLACIDCIVEDRVRDNLELDVPNWPN
jgi:hypothetical protein